MGVRLLVSSCALFLLSNTFMISEGVGNEIYKWTDAEGNIHYGDRPESEDATEVRVDKKPKKDTSLEQRRVKQNELLNDIEHEKRTRNDQKEIHQTWDDFLGDLGGDTRSGQQ